MIAAALLACGISVHPVTLEAVIRVESSGRANAVNLNRDGTRDFGLMQVNERNLAHFGVTPQQVMDPCTNIRIGSAILAANYARASQQLGPGQPALLAALSAYNTGDFARGFQNGYVAKYVSVPQLTAPVIKAAAVSSVRSKPQPANPYAADTEVRWSNALLASSN